MAVEYPHNLEYVGPITSHEFTLWERYFQGARVNRRVAKFSRGLWRTGIEFVELRTGTPSERVTEDRVSIHVTQLYNEVREHLNLKDPSPARFNPINFGKSFDNIWYSFQLAFTRIMGINYLDWTGEVPQGNLIKKSDIFSALRRGRANGTLNLNEGKDGLLRTPRGTPIYLPDRISYSMPDLQTRAMHIGEGYDFRSTVARQDLLLPMQYRQTFSNPEALKVVRQSMHRVRSGRFEDPNPPEESGIQWVLVVGDQSTLPADLEPGTSYNRSVSVGLQNVRGGALLALCYLAEEGRNPQNWRASLL